MPKLGKHAEELSKENAALRGELDARKVQDVVKAARMQDALDDIRRGMAQLTRLLPDPVPETRVPQ